jgi:DNA-binding NarL/FixJ family response regulator
LLTVLVLGGSPLENAGLRALISAGEQMCATDEPSLASHADGSCPRRPDVVVLAVDIDDGTADMTIQATRSKWKPAPILVVADDFDRRQALQLVCAGARGVIDHDRSAVDLIKAIRKVAQGELWVDRLSLALLIDELAQHARRPHPVADRITRLTAREREVVELVTRGLSNKAIGKTLDISDNTVRHHLTAIFEKLGVTDRLGLACYAIHQDRPLVQDARLSGIA